MARHFQRPFELPAGATEVVLIRHGSVEHRRPDGPVGSVSDPELNDTGRAQAEAIAARLSGREVTAMFVTPLRRTRQTLDPLARRLHREPAVAEDLREVYLGDWEGQLTQRIDDGDPMVSDLFAAERWDVLPGAEPSDAFAARIARGLGRVADAAGADGTALAVVHGGVIAEACRQVTASRGFAFLYAENASLTRLMRQAGGGWALISFNDTAHLTAA